MHRLLALALPALVAATPAQPFEIDISVGAFLQRVHGGQLGTIAPGQFFSLHSDFLCHMEGALYAYAPAPPAPAEDFAWLARRTDDGALDLGGMLGGAPAPTDEVLTELEIVLLWQHCDDYHLTAAAARSDLLPVDRVNGARQLSALLGD